MNSESQDILTALLDGQLTTEQAAEVRARLEREPNLQKLYRQLEVQREQLRQLERVAASPDFAARVAAEVRERAGVVALPAVDSEETGPRGGWRSVYLLASSLAALLLLAVFLWPRDVADDSAKVAQTDSQLKRKEMQIREQERDLAMNAPEPEPAAVRRAPSGGLPRASSGAAVGDAEKLERQIGGGGQFAPPDSQGLETPVPESAAPGAAAPGGSSAPLDVASGGAPPAMAKSAEAAPGNLRPEAGVGGAATVASETEEMSQFKNADALANDAAPAVEVWMVGVGSAEPSNLDESVAGEEATEQGVELYLATVEQPELPTWLEELRSSAEITQLDPSESRALLNQLAAANQSHDKQQGVDADNRTGNRSLPSEAAEAILDEQPAGEGSQARRARVEEMAGLNVAYLGIEKSTAIASVIERANVRQQNSLNSANEPKAAGGLALGGGGKAGDAAAGLEAKNELAKRDESTQVEDSRQAWLQSNRLQLREQANRPGLEEESSGIQLQRANRQLGLGGRQIIIVIPPR